MRIILPGLFHNFLLKAIYQIYSMVVSEGGSWSHVKGWNHKHNSIGDRTPVAPAQGEGVNHYTTGVNHYTTDPHYNPHYIF